MHKRPISIIIAIVFILTLIPINIFASDVITLNDISDKKPGDTVTIYGTNALGNITVKVLRPDNTIFYFNTLMGTDYSDSFTLPLDTMVGNYKVIVGKGEAVAVKIFNVQVDAETPTIPSSGNEEATPLPKYEAVVIVGAESVKLNITVDIKSGNAGIKLDGVMLDNLLKKAINFESGIKTVTVSLPNIEGVRSYSIDLPVRNISSENYNSRLQFNTPVGTLSIPDQMLTGLSEAGGKAATISIGHGDKSKLSSELKTSLGDRPLIQLNMTVDGKLIEWNNPNVPVTLSIPFKPIVKEMDDPEHIGIWYIDQNGSFVPVPTGRYDSKTGEVNFTTTHFSYYAVSYVQKSFRDLDSVAWAKKQVEVLASKGIIGGTSNDTFSPDKAITRADYMVLLVRTLGLSAKFTENFNDVVPGEYYYDAVGIAKALGITSGTGNNNFNPKANISRQDMMVLTTRALTKSKDLKGLDSSSVLDKFKDKEDIAEYAKESMATLVSEGLINGSGNNINPRNNTTRAEAAVLLYNIYNKY